MLLSDPHRHSQDDSWVFGAAAKGDRGKVDRADRTVDTGRSTVPSAKSAARSRAGRFRLALLQLPYCIRPASPLTNLPACRVCSSVGQTLWNGVTVVQQTHHTLCEARRHVGVCELIPDHFCHPFQSSTLFPITFNQGYDSLTVALRPFLSILPWSVLTCPLLQFFFFSLFLSADSHWHTEN